MKSIKFVYTGLAALILAMGFQACVKDYDNPADGTLGEFTTLYALRQNYHGNAVIVGAGTMGGAYKIQGVVISDKNGMNIEPGSFVIQETLDVANTVGNVTRGIVVKLNTGTADYLLGDSLNIDVSGAVLDRINGKMVLSGVATSKITKVADGRTVVVRDVNQGLLHAGMDQYESTLVSIHADVVDFAAGATYTGQRKLRDNTGPDVYLHTLPTATVAGTQLDINAQFTGIAGFLNETSKDTAGAKKTIQLRNATDIKFSSGALYNGFPENFESPDASVKASYNSGTNIVALATGNWYLLQAILGNTLLSDKFNQPGKQAIRMQQNLTTSGYTQMNFDLPDGASKVTVFYGKYATDARSSFRLEYSINGGTTWIAVGANITDMPDKGSKQATWTMNITVPVRFRINKLGIGTSNNGRLSLDDFAVYKKL